MDSELLSTAATAAGAVALVLIGAWENDRRSRKTEARRDAAADRAALEGQANELVAAVLALKVAGNMRDHLLASWTAKARLGLRAAMQGASAVLLSGRADRESALPAFFRGAGEAVLRWERDSEESAAALAAPLSRLGAAVVPLLWRDEPGLAAAADAVFTAAVEGYGDDDRMTRALEAFHAALRPALAQPSPESRRRWIPWRRRRAVGA